MESAISIKGTREGLAITLGEGDLDTICAELTNHLERQGAFFRGGVVTLDARDRALDERDIVRVRDALARFSMVLRTVRSENEGTRKAVTELGLLGSPVAEADGQPAVEGVRPTLSPENSAPDRPAAEEAVDAPVAGSQSTAGGPDVALLSGQGEGIAQAGARGLILRRRVRAGQTVRHSGSVVVIGDVNAGAEIISGCDVVIWGRLRGTVHAGCLGNASAVVCALDLSPVQLRIADLITRPEDGAPRRGDSYPEVAYVRDRTIIVERWTAVRWRD